MIKVHLMYKDKNFDNDLKISLHDQELIQDLELKTIFDAMADDDRFIFDTVKTALFTSLNNEDDILYRQEVLKDCIKNPNIIRKLYKTASDTIEQKRKYWWGVGNDSPSSVLYSSVSLLQMFADMLKKIRKTVDNCDKNFESDGFKKFINTIESELNNEYLAILDTHLKNLKFSNGILISADLGKNNQGINYILRSEKHKKLSRIKWNFTQGFCINKRDDNGCTDLGKRKDRAINITADTLAQSAENVLNFFIMLRKELAFYVGCINLYDKLSEKGKKICLPNAVDSSQRKHSFKGLYDISLALLFDNKIVGNEINADDKDLIIITGANQGGKSTFLRSIGQAQLMMQCGMFVCAEYFYANICDGMFTHFKREEDHSMESGKLDEELKRISNIINDIKPNSMILFNESFAATNEREGSEISRQIVSALIEKKIKVFFVTHLYEFAHNFYIKKMKNSIFLRAQRQSDGSRTFKLGVGEPLKTSYGEDLYNKIF